MLTFKLNFPKKMKIGHIIVRQISIDLNFPLAEIAI